MANKLENFRSTPVVKRAIDRYITKRSTKYIGGGILSLLGGGLFGQAIKGTLLRTGGPKAWEIAQKGILGKTGKFQSGKQFGVYVKNYLKRNQKDYKALTPYQQTIPQPTNPTSKTIGNIGAALSESVQYKALTGFPGGVAIGAGVSTVIMDEKLQKAKKANISPTLLKGLKMGARPLLGESKPSMTWNKKVVDSWKTWHGIK